MKPNRSPMFRLAARSAVVAALTLAQNDSSPTAQVGGEKENAPDSVDPLLRMVPLEKNRISPNQTPGLRIPPRPVLETVAMQDCAPIRRVLRYSAATFVLVGLLSTFQILPGFCGGADNGTPPAANVDNLAAKGKAELEAAVKSLRPHESFDTTPIEFSIWDTHFRIPRNYLVVMENWSGGPQTDVTLRVTLPRLEPLTEKTRPCLVDKPVGEIAGCVPFEFRISGSGPSPDVTLSRIRKSLLNQDPLPGKYEFDYYELGSNTDIYRKVEDGEIFQYECDVFPRGSLNGGCSHQNTRVSETTEIRYFFPPSKLSEVVELDKRLLTLVRSFFVIAGDRM